MKRLILTITSLALTLSALANEQQKEINTLADEQVCAKILDKISVYALASYESEYVSRGLKWGGRTGVMEVDLSYDFGNGFGGYSGVWMCDVLDTRKDPNHFQSEFDLYTSLTYTTNNLTLELGYLAYLYAKAFETTHEIKFAFVYDTAEYFGEFNVSPKMRCLYDFVLESTLIEGGLKYSAPVTKWLIDRNWGTINLSALYGWSTKIDGAGYSYFTTTADACVAINKYCSFSVGIRYSYAYNAPEHYRNTRDTIWFGTGLSISL